MPAVVEFAVWYDASQELIIQGHAPGVEDRRYTGTKRSQRVSARKKCLHPHLLYYIVPPPPRSPAPTTATPTGTAPTRTPHGGQLSCVSSTAPEARLAGGRSAVWQRTGKRVAVRNVCWVVGSVSVPGLQRPLGADQHAPTQGVQPRQ